MNRWTLMLLLVCLAVLTAPSASFGSAARPAAAADLAAPEGAERSLESLAAGVFRALESPEIRQRLHEEMQHSPYVERRIALKRWLEDDAAFREEILWYAGITTPWEHVSAALPELELYFPFTEHRTAWSGHGAIAVAVPIQGGGRYRVFSPDGETTAAPGTRPPRTPTLLLAPAEIDFDDAESALATGSRTGNSLRRRYLGAVDAAPDAGMTLSPGNRLSTKSSGVDNSRHTSVGTFVVYDDHDPWRGSMEIEIYGSVDGSYDECQRFTGIDEDWEYWYDAGTEKVAYAVPTGTNTVDVDLYEDDDTGCVLKSGDDYIGTTNRQIIHYGGMYGTSNGKAAIRLYAPSSTCGDATCEWDESSYNCCSDCATCGDGTCQSQCGESGSTCSADCFTCGDGVCESWKGESYWNCSADCSSCGNGFCDPGEDYFSCPSDCCDGQRICPE